MMKKQYISFIVLAIFIVGSIFFFREPGEKSDHAEETAQGEEIKALQEEIFDLKDKVNELSQENKELNDDLKQALVEIYLSNKNESPPTNVEHFLSLYEERYKSENDHLSSLLSKREGTYYFAVYGASDEETIKFQELYADNLMRVSGYLTYGNPDHGTMLALNIEELPKFIGFNTEEEVFRTTDINELEQFIIGKTEGD